MCWRAVKQKSNKTESFELRPEMRLFGRGAHDCAIKSKINPFATGNFNPFRTFLVWVQVQNLNNTVSMSEKIFPKMFRSSTIYGSKALKISLKSDQKWNLRSGTNISVETHYIFNHRLYCMQWEHQRISSCNCVDKTNFGNCFFLMNTCAALLNFLIVCIQTGSVWNGWKFVVAKWTERAL